MNILYADSHVGNAKTPCAGMSDDNIFTASNIVDDGDPAGTSTSITQHLCDVDSFLIGATD